MDSLRKEMALMQEAAREHQQQGAIGDETAALPGALKDEEAIKEKDRLPLWEGCFRGLPL